jgi:hypothetical protein
VTHFEVNHPSVSRHHLDVKPTARGVEIVHRGTVTLVNGTPLPAGAVVMLAAGDALRLGEVALTVEEA